MEKDQERVEKLQNIEIDHVYIYKDIFGQLLIAQLLTVNLTVPGVCLGLLYT